MRFVTVLLLSALAWTAQAEERILSFHSAIGVAADGTMEVTETIQVRAKNQQINRGIFRDFPTDYRDRAGNRYRVGFKLLGVWKNDQPEPYHTQAITGGVRTYIGNENVILAPGEYKYTLRYRTDRQLGFFKAHDELYWNVTGNNWAFPIDRATATVQLPEGILPDAMRVEAYTGYLGDKGKSYRATVSSDGVAHFQTTEALRERQGLTIVVTWPKGFVTEPSTGERLAHTLGDNLNLLIATGGLLLLLLYYVTVWLRMGKDPETGVIIPIYTPPEGYSPAAMRFIRRMGYDHKTFAAALVNLAVKGCLKISKDGSEYSVKKTTAQPAPELAPGERVLLGKLFAAGDTFSFETSNHTKVAAALKSHKKSLSKDYERIYFHENSRYVVIGALISIAIFAAFIATIPLGEQMAMSIFSALWLGVPALIFFSLLRSSITHWRAGMVVQALMQSVVFLVFLGFIVIGGWFSGLGGQFPIMPALLGLALIMVNYLFYHWMKAPTSLGRRLLDRVEGFKRYIEVAEKQELQHRYPENKTPALFEKYLPYAIALDVEQKWGQQFAGVLLAAGTASQAYQPQWYDGNDWDVHSVGDFSKSIGNGFASSIASSSQAPGSSSGSGGGGSSGGGGGGGGGGGW